MHRPEFGMHMAAPGVRHTWIKKTAAVNAVAPHRTAPCGWYIGMYFLMKYDCQCSQERC